jgi:hypothetical protein
MNRAQLKKKFPKAYAALEKADAPVPSSFQLNAKGQPVFTEDDELYTISYFWDGKCWEEAGLDDLEGTDD